MNGAIPPEAREEKIAGSKRMKKCRRGTRENKRRMEGMRGRGGVGGGGGCECVIVGLDLISRDASEERGETLSS